MNRKFISTLVATAAVVSMTPATNAFAATTVSASTNSVQVAETVDPNTPTPINIFDVLIEKNNIDTSKAKGYSVIETGSSSSHNKYGRHSYYTNCALLAVPGTKVTFSDAATDKRHYVSVDGKSLYGSEKKEREDTRVTFSFIMPNKTNSKIITETRGGSSSSSHQYTYTLIPLVGIETGNPTSEQAVTVQQAFLNFTANNNTKISDFQEAANKLVDTSKYTVTVTQSEKTQATESKMGSIKGNVIISSNDGKKTEFSFSSPISILGQSSSTLLNSYKRAIESFKGTNNTIESNIIDIVEKTNDDISVSVSDFKRVQATDKNEGEITGVLNVTGEQPCNFNIKIPKLAQSTDTAKTILKSIVENMVVTNSTNQESIQNLVNNSIDTTSVQAKVEITDNNKATETKKGNIVVNITISDKTGAKADVQISREIETEIQSTNTVKDLYKSYLDSMEKTNSTTEDTILNGVRITNQDITSKISNFNITKATETKKGSIQGIIEIKDAETNSSTTVPINLTVDYLHQAPSTVAKLYTEAAKSYIPTNDTNEQDIIDMIDITNKDIKVTPDSFKLIPSTDESTGKVSVNLTISDGQNSIVQPIQITINNQAQELSTALAETQKFLAGYKNTTNDINMDDLLIKINDIITNPSIFASYSNAEGERIEKVNATEDSKGYVKGALLLADSKGHKVKVPVDFEIAKLSQSLDTAETKINDYLNNLKGTNELKESDVVFNIQNLLDGDIKAKIEDYSIKESSESTEGLITGKVVLNKDSENKEIPINLAIDLKAQSMNNIIELINYKLKDMYLSNISTAGELETELSKCLTNAAGNKIKIKVADDDFRMMKATLDNDGSVRGKITLFDSNMNIQYVQYNIHIKQLAQTLDHAVEKVNEKLETYTATNDSTNETFIEILNSSKTNAEGSKITIKTTKFNLTEATEKTTGSLEVEVVISDGQDTKTINKTFNIGKRNQSIDEAHNNVDKTLPNIKGNNNTTIEDIKNQIKDSLGDNVEIEIKDFNKSEATNKENGKITGTIVIKDKNTSEIVEIPIEITIPKLEETLDKAQDTIDKTLPDIKVNNNTTIEDVKNQIKDSVGNNIEVEIKDFNKSAATNKENGKITGTVVITDKNTGEIIEIPIEITIPKLEETLDEAHNNVDKTLPDIKGNNNTTIEDIKNQIKDSVGDNIEIEIKDFNKSAATNKENGKITGTVVITDKNTGEIIETPIEITIPKLEISSNQGSSGGSSSGTNHHHNKNDIGKVDIEGQDNNSTFASNSDWNYQSGKWTHKTNGNYDAGWIQINERWYYFDPNGYMLTGWIENNEDWYYLSEQAGETLGAMQTAWGEINGTWYYFNDLGKIQTGWNEIDGTWYYLNPISDGTRGAMQTGWISDNGDWYYLDINGKMQIGWNEIDGTWYFLNPISNGTKGAMQTGWINYNEGWYYLDINGKMQTGWNELNGNWYYFSDSGLMQNNCEINGYKMSQSGALIA